MEVAGLLQVYSYAFAVVYALFIGGIDFGWPIKVAFGSALFYMAVRAIIAFNIVRMNPNANASELGMGAIDFGIDVFFVLVLAVVGALFLLRPIASVNLTSLDLDVKGSISLGVALSLLFTNTVIQDLRRLGKRRPIPPVIVAPPEDQGESEEP